MEFLGDAPLADQRGVAWLLEGPKHDVFDAVSLSSQNSFPTDDEGSSWGRWGHRRWGTVVVREELGCPCLSSALPWSPGPAWSTQGAERSAPLIGLEAAPSPRPVLLEVSEAQTLAPLTTGGTSWNCCPSRGGRAPGSPCPPAPSLSPADVGPVTLTEDPAVFQRELRELYVQVGCPAPGCWLSGPFFLGPARGQGLLRCPGTKMGFWQGPVPASQLCPGPAPCALGVLPLIR